MKSLSAVVKMGSFLLTSSLSRGVVTAALTSNVNVTRQRYYKTLSMCRLGQFYSIEGRSITYNNHSGIRSKCSHAKARKPTPLVTQHNSTRFMSDSDERVGFGKDPSAAFIFRQLFEHKSYTYTYLLGCMKTRQAILIDPVFEMVPRDVKLLEQLGLTLKYAINTHVHADHITGSGKLKQQIQGSASALSVDAGAKADIYLDQGEKLCVGEIELEARKTPGHTNGCMTYVWHGRRRVFTGDSVLIRGCGRTDFQEGSPDKLYTSVQSQIFALPDDYVIYPAHDYTGQPWTTVGEEKEHNPRLSKSREEFIKLMNNLNLPYPKQIDRALPANLLCGITDELST